MNRDKWHLMPSDFVVLTFTTPWANSADYKLMTVIFIFPRKQDLTVHADCLHYMKCLNLFSFKNKKQIFQMLSADFLPRALSVKDGENSIRAVGP